jgi:hypothetical protein
LDYFCDRSEEENTGADRSVGFSAAGKGKVIGGHGSTVSSRAQARVCACLTKQGVVCLIDW